MAMWAACGQSAACRGPQPPAWLTYVRGMTWAGRSVRSLVRSGGLDFWQLEVVRYMNYAGCKRKFKVEERADRFHTDAAIRCLTSCSPHVSWFSSCCEEFEARYPAGLPGFEGASVLTLRWPKGLSKHSPLLPRPRGVMAVFRGSCKRALCCVRQAERKLKRCVVWGKEVVRWLAA